MIDRSTKKIDTEVESTSKNTKSPVKKAKPSTSKQQTSPNKPSTLKQQSTPKKVATPKKAVPPKKAVSPKKKAKTSKKQSAEVDSGISSGEQQKNRLSKNSPSKSTLTKINKKSKTAISKTKNKTVSKKKVSQFIKVIRLEMKQKNVKKLKITISPYQKRVSEIHWLKGLLQDEMISQLKKQNSISGIGKKNALILNLKHVTNGRFFIPQKPAIQNR